MYDEGRKHHRLPLTLDIQAIQPMTGGQPWIWYLNLGILRALLLEALQVAQTETLEPAGSLRDTPVQWSIAPAQNPPMNLLPQGYVSPPDDMPDRETLLNQVLNQLTLCVWVIRPDGVLIEVNQAALALAALTPDTVLGCPFLQTPWWTADSTTQTQLKAAIAQASQGTPVQFEQSLHTAEGQPIVLDLSFTPLAHRTDTVAHVLISGRDITPAKRIEAQLQESEERWQLALRGTQDGFWDWHVQTQQVFFSDRWKEMRGYAPEELPDTLETWEQGIHPDDREAVKQRVEAYFARKIPQYSLEYRVRHKDGSYLWIWDRGEAYWDSTGRVIRMAGSESDITQRKQAEKALRESQNKYQTLFEVFPIGISITDPQGQLLEANHASEQILGLSLSEHQNRTYDAADWQIVRPDGSLMPPEEFASVRALREQRFVNDVEMGVLQPTGEIRWISVSAAPIPLDEYGVAIAYVDITRRKAAESALRQSETLLTLAQQVAHIGNWELDVRTQAFSCSDELLRIMGLPPGSPPPAPEERHRLYHPDDRDMTRAIVQRSIATGEPCAFDARILHPDGTIRFITVKGQAIRDEQGQVIKLFGTTQDITDRKLVEIALQTSEAKFLHLVAATPGVIYSLRECLDGSVRFDYLSPGFEEIHEVSVSEGMKNAAIVFEQMHPDDRFAYQESVAQSRSSLSLFRHEWRNITPSGKLKWLKANSRPELQDNGDLVWHGIVLDITDRKRSEAERSQAEQALRESQERFQVFMNNAPILAWLVSAEGQIVYGNPAWLTILDSMAGNPIGQFLEELFPAEFAQEYRRNNQRAIESGEIIETVETGPGKDGSLRSYLVRKFPIYREDHSIWVGGVAIDITERQQAEAALQQSESRLQLALEGSGDGFWDLNIRTGDLYLSPRWCRMLGYAPPELADHISTWEQLIHPEDLPWVQRRLQTHLADPTVPYQFDYRLRTKTGDWKWIANYGKVVAWDETGKPIRMAGTHRDISDRKQAEAKLQQTKEQLELAFQASHDGFWDWNLVTGEIYFSPRWKEMLGYADHELPNSLDAWELVIFEEDRIAAMQLIEDYNTGKLDRFLTTQRFHHKNGSTVYVLSRAIHLQDEQGHVVRMIGAHSDITETIKIQEALQTSEMQLSGVLDSSLDGIMAFRAIRNETGKIIDFEWLLCNPAAAEMVGQSSSRLIGRSMLQEWPRDRDEGLFDLCLQVVEFGTPIQREFHDQQHGRDRWFQITVVCLGEGCAVTFRDVTPVKQSEQTLQQLNEQLEDRVRDLKVRNDEMQLLSEVSDFLQACLTFEEACAAITTLIEPLFPGCSGGVFMISASRNRVENVAAWGRLLHSETVFHPNRCWGLRRGRIHYVDQARSGLRCNHIEPDPEIVETLCIPMIAQGETLGLLYLSAERTEDLSIAKQQIARTVAEQVALAIANLRLRETLQSQSIRDPLTGLFNRRYLEEFLSQEIHRSQRNHYEIGIVMLDIDHFKHFNDTFGHDAGDVVLQEVGKLLKSQVRGSDVACRYGGEELTLIFPETSLEQTADRAEALREAIAQLQLNYSGKALGTITASLGVASFPDQGLTGEAIVQAADAALYRAKEAGRNRVMIALA